MAKLILLNGTPGIGKSTLARRYIDDHPLTLNVDIDEIRSSLGRWEDHSESVALARALGVAMARAHLASGHDVVLPQFVVRPTFIDALEQVARETGSRFRQVIVADTIPNAIARFRMRRAELASAGARHPEAEIEPSRDGEIIEWAANQLGAIARAGGYARVLDTTVGDIEGAYRALCHILNDQL